jgi:hypothetical protein
LTAVLLDLFGRIEAKDLEFESEQITTEIMREQVRGEPTGGSQEGN